MKELKISVIKPPSNYRRIYPPLGLGYVASVLIDEGFDVEFLDATLIDFPFELLGGIPRFYWKRACVIDWRKIRSHLLNRTRRADIALIGGSFTADIYNTARIADILKERNKSCLTIVGGTHVSALPRQTLKEFPNIDIVVRGEGEFIVRELINRVTKGQSYRGIRGIAYRERTGAVTVEEKAAPIGDINKVPHPSRNLMPMDKYRLIWRNVQTGPAPGLIGDPAGLLISTRGCIRRCFFCAIEEISCGRMRMRSAENVINEIEALVRDYGIKIIGFVDDFFTINSRRTLEVCNALKRLKLKWHCYGIVNTISEELLGKMKDSGCMLINYGLESGDQGILNTIGKGTTLKQIKKALAITRKVGIKYTASFTIGMPGESKETIQKTVRLAKMFGGVDAEINRIIPYPGSPLYKSAVKNNWLIPMPWDMYDSIIAPELVYIPPGWSKEGFKKAFSSACADLNRHFRIRRLVHSGSLFKRMPSFISSFFLRRRR